MNILWVQTGDFLFFMAYFMLLLFWADFYYRVDGSSKGVFSKFRIPIAIAVSALGLFYVCIAILSIVFCKMDNQAEMVDEVSSTTLSFFFFVVGIAFLYFGIRLTIVLQKFRLLNRKKSQTRKVVGVAVLCTLCFVARASVVMFTVVKSIISFNKQEFNAPWEVSLAFFLLLEALPIALMLFLLRKLPVVRADLGSNKPLLSNRNMIGFSS